MRKQWVRDWGRRLLLLALLVSAVLLLRHTGLYSGFRNQLKRSMSTRTEKTAGTDDVLPHPLEVMQPLAVTVQPGEGAGRWGAAYDAAQTAAAFQRFLVDLSEALGSAGTPAPRTQEELHACMERSCVALHFAAPLRLELLSGWLGLEMTSSAAHEEVQMLCLSASETEVLLCCRTQTGDCFACTTAVHAEGFLNRTAEYVPNGTLYGWESERLENGGESVLLSELPEIAAVKSTAPLPRGGETDAILTALGMNSFVTSSYSESDGTVVYVSDETTMRIGADGSVFFRRTGTPEAGGETSLTAAVARACRTAEQCLGPFLGSGALRFAGATDNPSQRTRTVLFDYAVNGIPVRLASGHAAELVLRGGEVVQARLALRQFTLTEDRTELLPCLQAAAIAARRNGRPELIYADAGDATACMWVIADG